MPLENGQPYDVRNHHDVLGSLIERAKTSLTDDQRVLINAACRGEKFCNVIQFPPHSSEVVEPMTLGELSALGKNDPGLQNTDVKAVENILFGPYGLIEHKRFKEAGDDLCKLGERPVIAYLQPDPSLEATAPAIASGRHRNYGLQILLMAAGVSWEVAMQQPIWVTKTICRTKGEYTMMMELANGQQARKQSSGELKSFGLSKRGVILDDLSHLVSTRLAAQQGQYGDIIATGVSMGLSDDRKDLATAIWDRSKTAWTKACRISPEHKATLIKAFKEDGDQIRNLMATLSSEVGEIMDDQAGVTSSKTYRERVNEALTDVICETFSLPKNTWETAAQKAERTLADLEARQLELRQYVQG